MMYIPVILGTIRRGRMSERVAKFIVERVKQREGVETELLDLMEYNFPILEERLRLRDDPPPGLREFAGKIDRADGIIIVTPEYNSGYPGAIKNAIDYLLPEFKRKPVGIVSVSGGPYGGLNALFALRQVIFGVGAFPIPARLPVSNVQATFNPDGTTNEPYYEKTAKSFIDDMLWFTEAITAQKMKSIQPIS